MVAASIALLMVATMGCASTGRLEIGVHRAGDGPPTLRLGLSVGTGVGSATRSRTRSLTQSIGYRHLGDHAWTTTTRYLSSAGPAFLNAAIEVARDGIELVPAILFPFHRSVTCYYSHQDCVGPQDPYNQTSIKRSLAYSVGLQPRVGRDAGETSIGLDVVVGFDGYSGL